MTEPSKELVVASNAYSRASLTERQQYIRMLAAAGNLLPPHLRGAGNVGDPGKAFLLAETGDMLGIHPMAAVVGVHIIEGKPSISANLMTGLVRKAGHILRVKVEGKPEDKSLKVTAQLIRHDDPDFTHEVVWTVADAERAGLWGKGNWAKYPRAMMKSRTVSEIIREAASDVLMGGNVYTPDELGATVNEDGEVVDMPQVPDSTVPDRDTSEPRPETPIPDETPADGAEPETDWVKRLADVTTKQEASDLYQEARVAGALTQKVKIGRKNVELGQEIIKVGAAFAEKEAAEEQGDPDDPNVVDAEIVDEGEPAVLADPETGEVQE
jgi:hypothetical protein